MCRAEVEAAYAKGLAQLSKYWTEAEDLGSVELIMVYLSNFTERLASKHDKLSIDFVDISRRLKEVGIRAPPTLPVCPAHVAGAEIGCCRQSSLTSARDQSV
jgi:hypothetical protein